MASLEAFLPTGSRYCSAMPALDKFLCPRVVPTVSPCCRSSSVVHPAWIAKPLTPQRCQWITHCPPSPEPAWKRLSASGRSVGLDSNIPVLVRGEQDGFYYRGTVKEEVENERGMFLVEFAKPLVSHGRHPVCVQKTAKDDILEYVNRMKHSLLPGDKVLAPWEPSMARHLVFQSEMEKVESSSQPPPCLLEPKSPKSEAAAAVAPSSPSSDSEWDLEPFTTQNTVVDSAVNTGSGCLEKPRLKDSARPEWKYWKRSHHKSHPSNSGLISCSSTCAKSKLEPKDISTGDTFSVASTNHSAMFETIEQSARGQVTMKEILRDQDFKLLMGVRRFVASEKQRYKTAGKKIELDDKHKATYIQDDKLDHIDHVRRERTGKISKELTCNRTERHDELEFNKSTTDEAQELKFQVNCL
ncbi:uncharacterized protein C11orf16 homolog isoform 2-T2 [Ara ararauna]